MQKDQCYILGKITKPHGLKGEVQIWLDVDDPSKYSKLTAVLLDIRSTLEPFEVKEIQIRGKKSIIRFEGFNRIEDTEKIIGAEVYLPLTKLPKLSKNQFYYHDILGFELIDSLNPENAIGTLRAIYESTGQDLFALDINEKEVLIPIIDDFIEKVDFENKKILLSLPDGLLDIYLS